MTILHDNYEIEGYEQSTNGHISQFTPEEIIHYRYMTINGQVEGFAPVEALASEILLLTLVKQNLISFMRNGGSPDKVFILPKEIANSANHKFLIQQLQKYKMIENRHGNLVFTGEMKIEDLQGSVTDMEYKDLSLYITSNIAYAYRIPITRIPYLIGASASKGDSGGLSESGYWNNISDVQDTVEDLLNGQLFESLGWKMKLPRRYKQDEVREAQTSSMNAATVTSIQNSLSRQGFQMNKAKLLSMYNFHDEDIEEVSIPIQDDQDSMNGQNQLRNEKIFKSQDEQNKIQSKKNVANQKGTDEAVTNP
jgi:hypothetical protein